VKYCLVTLLCLSLFGCSAESQSKAPLPVGRYQIVHSQDQLFLLDTTDGEVWRWVWSKKDADGNPVWYWALTDNTTLAASNSIEQAVNETRSPLTQIIDWKEYFSEKPANKSPHR
jgi:hypothetical protein